MHIVSPHQQEGIQSGPEDSDYNTPPGGSQVIWTNPEYNWTSDAESN